MDRGAIWLFRSLLDHELFKERERFTKREAWIDLLLQADHRTGAFFASLRFMADRWKWSKDTVRRFLLKLQAEQMIQIGKDDHSLIRPRKEIIMEGKRITPLIHPTQHIIISNCYKI